MLKYLFIILFPFFICASIDLSQYEKKLYSQNGEDGVILAIFNCIGTKNKYYVEFGAQDGNECNTHMLRELRWNGLLMDGGYEIEDINLKKEFITQENINDLFNKYDVPLEFDLLSIDIDFNDFYVWNAINDKYKPRVVIIEYNAAHLPYEDKIVRYQPKGCWDGTIYYGASILAMKRLGNHKGYTLVYADSTGVNLFFIRNDILKQLNIDFKDQDDEIKLYRPADYYHMGLSHSQDALNREFVSSLEVELR